MSACMLTCGALMLPSHWVLFHVYPLSQVHEALPFSVVHWEWFPHKAISSSEHSFAANDHIKHIIHYSNNVITYILTLLMRFCLSLYYVMFWIDYTCETILIHWKTYV